MDEATVQVILVFLFLLFVIFYPAYLGLFNDMFEKYPSEYSRERGADSDEEKITERKA